LLRRGTLLAMDNQTPPYGRLLIPQTVVFEVLDEEAIVLDMESGNYYRLNPTGTAIWKLIEQLGEVQEVQRAMLEAYDVTPQQLRADLFPLIDTLAGKGLLVAAPS